MVEASGPQPSDDRALFDHQDDNGERLRFRILRHRGERKVFRLEEVYWALLERAAKDRGLRLSEYVHRALAGREDSNQAAALRVLATRWLLSKHDDLQATVASDRLLRMLQVAPAPCFAVGANRSLVAYNQAFAEIVRSSAGSGAQAVDVASARFSLDPSLQRLFEVLGKGDQLSVTCGYVIQVGDRRRTGRARVMLLPGNNSRILVGYLNI
jgi:predicted DNA-binding ribbon-helix-helix protein